MREKGRGEKEERSPPEVEDSPRVYRPVGSFYESTIRRIVDRRLVERMRLRRKIRR
jgi:hypothetical protein